MAVQNFINMSGALAGTAFLDCWARDFSPLRHFSAQLRTPLCIISNLLRVRSVTGKPLSFDQLHNMRVVSPTSLLAVPIRPSTSFDIGRRSALPSRMTLLRSALYRSRPRALGVIRTAFAYHAQQPMVSGFRVILNHLHRPVCGCCCCSLRKILGLAFFKECASSFDKSVYVSTRM